MMEEIVDKALAFAIEARFTTADVVYTSENDLRAFTAFQNICSIAKDYGITRDPKEPYETINKEIKSYNQKNMDLVPSPFSTLPGWTSAFPEEPLTQYLDPVITLIKQGSQDTVIQSLSGIELYSKITMKNISSPQLIWLGKHQSDVREFLHHIYTSHSGSNAEKFLKDSFKTFPYNKALEKIHTLVKKIGLALGELHSFQKGQEMTWPKSLIQHYKSLLGPANEILPHLPDIDFHLLNKYFLHLFQLASITKYPSTFTQGFAHLNQFIYADIEDQLFLHRVSGAHFSIDRFGNPIGSPATDFASFEQTTQMILSETCCQQEDIANICTSWREGYLSTAEELPPEDQINFIKLMFSLIYLEKIFSENQRRFPTSSQARYPRFSLLINYLKKSLTNAEF
ncbi:MAG: hypothetical protein ACI9S8_001152 [Chlamydiales bacterium]|jgi:hypothetical protein